MNDHDFVFEGMQKPVLFAGTLETAARSTSRVVFRISTRPSSAMASNRERACGHLLASDVAFPPKSSAVMTHSIFAPHCHPPELHDAWNPTSSTSSFSGCRRRRPTHLKLITMRLASARRLCTTSRPKSSACMNPWAIFHQGQRLVLHHAQQPLHKSALYSPDLQPCTAFSKASMGRQISRPRP